MRVHLTVTEQHIAHGVREDCARCPIALALRDAVPGGVGAVVVDGALQITHDGVWWSANHTATTVAFIRAFDDGDLVEPFEMDLLFEKEL